MSHKFLYCFWWVCLRFCHPVWHIEGAENLPPVTDSIICANHYGLPDPFWILMAWKPKKFPRVLAKEALLEVPILGKYLKKIGVIGVRRGEADVNAIKAALTALRNNEGLLIFPEGTRIRRGKVSEPKSGVMLLASRSGKPIIPIYLQNSRRLFAPMRVIIGKPYVPDFSGKKPTFEELQQKSVELMDKIYALGKEA